MFRTFNGNAKGWAGQPTVLYLWISAVKVFFYSLCSKFHLLYNAFLSFSLLCVFPMLVAFVLLLCPFAVSDAS